MTREEILQYIKSELANENAEIYLDVNDYEIIVKALEQAPIIDKIRTEIEQKIVRRSGLNHTKTERDRNDAFLEVLDIIDKYNDKK